MADNVSGCIETQQQVQIANILLASSSFSCFVFGLVSILLNRFFYNRYKGKYPADPTEGILFFYLVACTSLELVDSFQWVLLLRSSVSCTVLGAVREYVLISILVNEICLGIHMFILMTHPKCLQVIKEEKQKKFKLLQRSYMLATIVVPIFIVPWPFINNEYGNDGYLCWLTHNCSDSITSLSYVLGRFLMWHLWFILAWLFSVVMLVLAICCYRRHTSDSHGTKSRPSHTVCTLILLLLIVFVIEIFDAFFLMWETISRKFSMPVAALAIISLPLMLVVNALIILIRQTRIKISKNNDIVANTNAESALISACSISYGATHFILPDDEWDY